MIMKNDDEKKRFYVESVKNAKIIKDRNIYNYYC